MSLTALSQALTKRFKQNVEEASVILDRVQYDNAPFDKPDSTKYWAKVDVRPGEPFRVEIGDNPRQRTPGLLVVSLIGPVDVGDKTMTELVDLVMGVFRNTSADGVVYKVPAPITVGNTSDGWWQVNVNCPFSYDEIY